MINQRMLSRTFNELSKKEILSKIKEELVCPKGGKMVVFKESIMGVDVVLENKSYNFILKLKSKECDLALRYDCCKNICKKFEVVVKDDMEIENIPYKEIKDKFINLLEGIDEKIYL